MTGEDPQILALPAVGDGLVLDYHRSRRVVLVASIDGHPHPLGALTDVRDAWRAVDTLDLAALDAARMGSLAA
jgi:hypothetical protein